MTVTETRQQYWQAIGEFVVTYAQLDLYSSMFFAANIKKVKHTTILFSVSVATSFYKTSRYSTLNNIILSAPKPNNKKVIERWKRLYPEIQLLEDIRNHLIHGTGTSLLSFEPISTTIIKSDNKTSIGKFLTINEIQEATSKLLKIIGEVKNELWHEYAISLGHETFFLTGINFQ